MSVQPRPSAHGQGRPTAQVQTPQSEAAGPCTGRKGGKQSPMGSCHCPAPAPPHMLRPYCPLETPLKPPAPKPSLPWTYRACRKHPHTTCALWYALPWAHSSSSQEATDSSGAPSWPLRNPQGRRGKGKPSPTTSDEPGAVLSTSPSQPMHVSRIYHSSSNLRCVDVAPSWD